MTPNDRNPLLRLLAWRPLPLVLGAVLFALVMLWTVTATPRYRSVALLQLTAEDQSSGLAGALAGVPGAPLLGLSKDGLETEMGVLRSRRVVDAVIDSLALTVRRASPALGRDEVAEVWLAEGGEAEGELVLRRAADGAYAVDGSDLKPTLTLPATVRVGDTLVVGGARIRLRALGAEEAPAKLTFVLAPHFETRRAFLDRLEVLRPSTSAQLVSLSLDDADPAIAARGLDLLVSEYLRYTLRSERGDARSTVEELRRQLAAQSEALARAEQGVRAFQERTGLVIPEEQGAAQVKRYATLRGTLDALLVEREALAAMRAVIAERAAGPGGSSAAYRQLATFPTLISNRAIQDLLLALTELENDRSALRLLRSEQNADVRQLSGRIAEIEGQLDRLGSQYLEALDGQIAPTREALAAIDAELLALPAQELTLVRLSREKAVQNEGYLALQRQLRQTEVQDALRRDQVRVVDAPEISDLRDPYFPKPAVHLVLGLILAFASAGAVVAARSALAD